MSVAEGPDPTTPWISVVVCTFNRAELLSVAMGSVLAQTWTDLELVVVDDGSLDDTRAVVAACADSRVRYVHQENGGLGVARNTGVAHATGTYVAFLDDDDLARPEWLARLAACGDGTCAVVCCGAVIATDDGTVVKTQRPGPLGPAFADYVAWFQPGTFAVRRDAYTAAGGFAEDLEHLEHSEFFLRLLPVCRARGWEVRSIPDALVELHVGGGRRVSPAQIGRMHRAMEAVLDRHGQQLGKDPGLLAQYYAVAGVAAAQTSDYRAARRNLRNAVRARPREWKHWARFALACVPPVGRRVWGRHPTMLPNGGL